MSILTKIANLYDGDRASIWVKAQLSGKRNELYYFYKPQMNLIRTLRKNKEYYRLSLILAKNYEAVEMGLECNIGFAINKELYEIQLEVLESQGKYELVEKLKENTPLSYMNSIVKE